MHDAVELINTRTLLIECEFSQARAIHTFIRIQNLRPEASHHLVINFFAGTHEIVRDFVGINGVHAELGKHSAD